MNGFVCKESKWRLIIDLVEERIEGKGLVFIDLFISFLYIDLGIL